jgi:hypothetical protein
MAAADRYASYLLRLWCEQSGETSTGNQWQGEIQHIQSGQSWLFVTVDELLDFLRNQSERSAVSELDHADDEEQKKQG